MRVMVFIAIGLAAKAVLAIFGVFFYTNFGALSALGYGAMVTIVLGYVGFRHLINRLDEPVHRLLHPPWWRHLERE